MGSLPESCSKCRFSFSTLNKCLFSFYIFWNCNFFPCGNYIAWYCKLCPYIQLHYPHKLKHVIYFFSMFIFSSPVWNLLFCMCGRDFNIFGHVLYYVCDKCTYNISIQIYLNKNTCRLVIFPHLYVFIIYISRKIYEI